MEKLSPSFFTINLVLLLVTLSLIFIVFDLNGLVFVFELLVLVVFIFLLTLGMLAVYHNKPYGWTILGATLILLLVNTIFISLLKNLFATAHLTVVIFSVVGLIIVLINLLLSKGKSYQEAETNEEYEKINEYYQNIDKTEPKEETTTKIGQPNIEKIFTPGKFIASKKANKFHAAKCDWAKRINKSNQLWFNSKEEAIGNGFEADRCVS